MGADVNFVDNDGNTPLFEAAMYTREIQMKELLDNGANVNYKNDKNITAVAIVRQANLHNYFNLHTCPSISCPVIPLQILVVISQMSLLIVPYLY